VRLTKHAAPLTNISTVQHLINCATFGKSHSALAKGLGLGLRNWPNVQHIWSNAQIDQMRLT